MSYLINRNPPARIECLHYLSKFIYSEFGVNNQFRMKDIKYDPSKINIFKYCHLLEKKFNTKYCPYKDNPLNSSGCALTNGILEDTTKSKEVSNTINSLDALGFVIRKKNIMFLTEEGKKFALTAYNSDEMLEIIQSAVLRYGMFVGMMSQISRSKTFSTDEINIGYPSTNEKINSNGVIVNLSSGSKADSNTRTKSCLLAWGVSAGFFLPNELIENKNENNLFDISRSYVLRKKRNLKKYIIIDFPTNLFDGNFITENPLDYNNLTKSTKALRENNQKLERSTTLQYEHLIKNRRYAIIYALNKAFEKKTQLNFIDLIEFLRQYPNIFVVSHDSFEQTMYRDLSIATVSGIPFKLNKQNHQLTPLTGINFNKLSENSPDILNEILFKFDNEL